MSDVKRSASVWAISDGRAGNARQAAALAAALNPTDWSTLTLLPRAPWRWWAPRRLPGDRDAFGATFARQLRRPPSLAIGCGRQGALATRLLRARGSQTVQILDPRLSPQHWDLVIVPEHDRLRGGNVLPLLGSLNPVDDAWLTAGRADFPELGTLPGPRIALLLGGPTRHVPWLAEDLVTLMDTLRALLRGRGSVLATVSRRTPADIVLALQARLRGLPAVLWRDEDDGPNPYAGLLGWADAVVCSADSSNLLSEACATRVPVAAAFVHHATGPLRSLSDALASRGRLATLDTVLDDRLCDPLRETERIAARVRERLSP